MQVPEQCVDQSVNYTILIMDRDENTIASQGPTVYMGKEQVEEDISEGLLERNLTYWIQVEAMTSMPEGKNLSEKKMIGSFLFSMGLLAIITIKENSWEMVGIMITL